MYKKLETCLCCNNKTLLPIFNLGDQPLANNYCKTPEEMETKFPLAINFCEICTHTQLSVAVDPDLLFRDYLYVSGTTKTLKRYFEDFATLVEMRLCAEQSTYERKNVLDVACNDGTQLDFLKKRGFYTHGIDPARNLYPISSKNHNVVCDYLNEKSIKSFNKKFAAIVAQNVFAHTSNPYQFLVDCKSQLEYNGLVFIQTSQADMFKNKEFDTIYHEHISFFSVKSFAALARRAGFYLIEVIRQPVHGTSFVFVLSPLRIADSTTFSNQEITLTQSFMEDYVSNCKEIAVKTKEKILKYKEQGYKVIGYGAAAKGNTFLNFADIDLDYIVDDNALKQGLFTPGKKIPILSPDVISQETGKLCVVPLSWNFFAEIKEKVLERKDKNIVFLKYFPVVE